MKISTRVSNSQDLKNEILRLENKKVRLESEFQEGFENLAFKLKPGNLLKSAVQQLPSVFTWQNNLLGYALGLGAGLISRKLLVGKSNSFLKKTLGNAVELGVAGLISKRIGKIKHRGEVDHTSY